MSIVLLWIQKCPGCGKNVESVSGGETWHETCWQGHKGSGCMSHAMCKKAKKEGWV